MTELEYDGARWQMTGLAGRWEKVTGGVEDMGVGDDGWGGRYRSGR
jgi:hypothetical protein